MNTCASPLQYAYLQLPSAVLAVSPADGAIYTAPSGNTYLVQNPSASPFRALRYEAITGSLSNGGNDIFEYTLPQQSAPTSIHVAARLADGADSEAFLSTVNCPEQPYPGTVSLELGLQNGEPGNFALTIRPNPTSGRLFIHLNHWQGQQVRVQVLNAQGQLVVEHRCIFDKEGLILELDAGLANGLYHLAGQSVGGARVATRFVLAR